MRVERVRFLDLAVVLHKDIPVRRRDDRLRTGNVMRDGALQQLSAHEADELGQDLPPRRALHNDQFELTVVRFCNGTDRNAAAELLSAADRGNERKVFLGLAPLS